MFKFLLCITLLLPIKQMAQTVSGRVSNIKNEPLAGATIKWAGTSVAQRSDENGFFIIAKTPGTTLLVASYSGYITDTIDVGLDSIANFTLQLKRSLAEVIVTAEKEGIIQSNRSPVKTEVLTGVELKKSACCDLAGCFETQGSVQSQTTNIITNAKELRILGLAGVYNQVLIDGFPMIQGLSFTYGISSIPGSIVDNIYISKGANSVLQGFESISGQINVETKKPDEQEKLFVNVYANSFLENT
jgi:outer membrane receptor for ferrienterochelin and colicins